MNKKFNEPPHLLNNEGKERKVGLEFEFTGIEMEAAAQMLVRLYGGKINQISTYEFNIDESGFGTFKLELDASLFLNKKYEKVLKSVGVDIASSKNKKAIENALRDVASTIVPFEIITPPVALSKLPEMENLIDELRRWRAKGTGSSMFYAFGLHLNPEAPQLSPNSILRHLQAYVLLDPWIRKDARINISRKITPYIKEYEIEYLRLILKEHYQPGFELLVDDYFRYENSRNRSLDLVPLFMYIDEELVREKTEDKLSTSRPTYHYRLPNCSLEDPDWTLAGEWNRWVLVEKLANEKKTLRQYANAFLKMDNDAIFSSKKKWLKLIERWVKQ